MERLRIKNFLVIEEADFDVGRFNIIIGSQASGKSIIAKLLYFFRKAIISFFATSASELENVEHLENKFKLYFKSIFPEYSWNKQKFQILYRIDDISIQIINGDIFIIKFSKEFIELYDSLKSAAEKNAKTSNSFFESFFDSAILLKEVISLVLSSYKATGMFSKILFIPATRSFFSTLQSNIFYLLSNNVDIDPLMKEFGANYEGIKREYENLSNQLLSKKINLLTTEILKGKYLRYEDRDWIVHNNQQKISLSNSSSGQQEALPMLLMMSTWACQHKASKIFIEEPEAHLFPVSQKHLISLFSLIYNQFYNDFVITTHSPYILTAINNAILAHDVITEKGKEAVKDIFDPDFAIKYEDVRAYTIEDGKLISILDDETRLIGASVIDSVSDEFENVFNSLLEL